MVLRKGKERKGKGNLVGWGGEGRGGGGEQGGRGDGLVWEEGGVVEQRYLGQDGRKLERSSQKPSSDKPPPSLPPSAPNTLSVFELLLSRSLTSSPPLLFCAM